MKKIDPIIFDLSKSLGFSLYCLPLVWDRFFCQYPFAEKFYALHKNSIRCQIYETNRNIL